MKKLLLLFTVAALVFSACKKNEPGGNGIATGEGCFASFKVDGEDYLVENMALCTYLDSVLVLTQSIGTSTFHLQIDPITSTGSYTADPTDPSLDVVIFMELNDGTTIAIANGTVNISKLNNNKVEGTFSGDFFDMMDFSMSPDFSVTNGVFEADL